MEDDSAASKAIARKLSDLVVNIIDCEKKCNISKECYDLGKSVENDLESIKNELDLSKNALNNKYKLINLSDAVNQISNQLNELRILNEGLNHNLKTIS